MAAVHPKVAASTSAGAMTVILVFIAQQAGLTVPPDVAAAVTVLLSAAAGYVKAG